MTDTNEPLNPKQDRREFLATVAAASAVMLSGATVANKASAEGVAALKDVKLIKIVDTNDANAVRNMESIIGLHETMINQKNPEEAVAKYLDPGYIQHDPLVETGAAGLAKFFRPIIDQRKQPWCVGHRIIAAGDYVFVHSNFLNIFNDDPNDTGIAGVDIFLMNADNKAIEHWEVLQIVGTPDNAGPWVAPNLKALNTNGMF